jgi:hypothetical protein
VNEEDAGPSRRSGFDQHDLPARARVRDRATP